MNLNNSIIQKKVFRYFVAAFVLSIFSFTLYSLFSGILSYSELEEKWDGVTIATSFSSGNGTLENPYMIRNAEEFMYFKSLIEGDYSSSYADIYYALEKDIDFNLHDITPVGVISEEGEERFFKGHFDGCGHALRNLSIQEGVLVDDTLYYALFTKTINASISTLGIDNYRIQLDEGDGKVLVAGFVGDSDATFLDSVTPSSFSNIYLSNYSIDIRHNTNSDNIIGAFIGEIHNGVFVHNIYLNGEIRSNDLTTQIGILNGEVHDNVSGVIQSLSFYGFDSEISSEGFSNYYVVSEGGLLSNGESFSYDTVLTFFNEEIDPKYYWNFDNGVISFLEYEKVSSEALESSSTGFAFSIRNAAGAISEHASGIDGTNIYINDLVSDANYYDGLNYTEAYGTSLPTGVKGSIYTSSNLVKTFIHYSGTNVEGDMTAYVGLQSDDEYQSDYYYYKYYPMSDGYLTFDLIDNPYSLLPNDKAFNGWITDYPGAVIHFDSKTYTRSVSIPITNVSDTVSITFYASFTDATIITSNAAASLRNLKTGMVQYEDIYGRDYGDLSGHYMEKTISNGESYTGNGSNGYFGVTGNRIWDSVCYATSCVYLVPSTSGYIEGMNYYDVVLPPNTWSNATVTPYDPPYTEGYIPHFTSSSIVAGTYKQVTRTNGQSIAGLYSNTGAVSTGNCTSTTCTLYELQQFYNDDGSINYGDGSRNYYYLATRDTNIFAPASNLTTQFTVSYPMTITGIHNGVLSNRTIFYNLIINNDFRIEHVTLSNITTNGSASTTPYIYGKLHNVKYGRGLSSNNNYINITGASNGGNNANTFAEYRLIVESGKYNNVYGITTGGTRTLSIYSRSHTTLGSDYDRVRGFNNNLSIISNYYTAQYVNMYYTSATFTPNTCSDLVVKSGDIGQQDDASVIAGIYMGVSSGGRAYCGTRMVQEGGHIDKIIGGVTIVNNFKGYNFTYLNIKGGSVNIIVGGASYSTTHGNRIINITGGTVEYSVIGGSNGANTGGNAVLEDSTFIHVGGNATIGTQTDPYVFSYYNARGVLQTYPNSTVEAGSIFGAGNGRSGNTTVGIVSTSQIVIDGNPTISGNIYAGGNFGRVGVAGTNSSSTISLLGGKVKGSIYGGGNDNGGGVVNYTCNSTININAGEVEGSVYGGSRTQGVLYGNTNVNVNGGSISGSVYGGGEGGYLRAAAPGTFVTGNVNVTVNDGTIYGSVYGGSAYGTVNAATRNATTTTAVTNVTVNGGVVKTNVFGGGKGGDGYTPGVIGDITVNINGGNISKVFGGFDDSGKPNKGDVVYLNGGVIGDAFGGGNNADQNTTDIRLQGSTINGNLYGGSNLLGTVTESHVTSTSGSVTNIFGGNNLAGSTTRTNVGIAGGVIVGDVYGGGNQAESTTTNVTIYDGTLNDVYGGGYSAGVSGTTNVTVVSGSMDYLFGGSNTSGVVGNTNINVVNSYEDRGLVQSVDTELQLTNQGANWEDASQKYITISPTIVNYSDHDYTEWTATLIIPGSHLFVGNGQERNWLSSPITFGEGTYTFSQVNKYDPNMPFVIPAGGSLTIPGSFDVVVPIDESYEVKFVISAHDTTGNTVYYQGTYLDGVRYVDGLDKGINHIFGGNNLGGSTNSSTINIQDGVIGEVFGGGNQVGVTTTTINAFGGTIDDIYGGSNESGDVTTSNVNVGSTESTIDLVVGTVYGGNNAGGVTSTANVTVDNGDIGTIFGGGNEAEVVTTNVVVNGGEIDDLYGGGNAAAIQTNTSVDLNGGTFTHNVYGGGNEGIVEGNTNVTITDTSVLGNAFAGGNGNTAIVYGNSTITIDGNTIIGSEESVSPNAGCVFGSGNAASTGLESNNSSVATVNIVGGTVYGNVYGGPKMAVVYGTTSTNIGTSAVHNNSLTEADLWIRGTVFGGGEANESGSDTYDYTFISVTNGIDVLIDGTGYVENNHAFTLNGSIFGSGNASSSAGDSNITIRYLGTREHPNKNLSIQRVSNLVIESSVIELEGTTDRTNELSDIIYSFNRIDKLIIKNGTTLLLQHNANLLKELYSGVDTSGTLVPAVVSIDDDTKTVTKNVDNRIYMLPGQNLNITITQDATDYGKVTGMTFFGMYNSYEGGTYRYGLYDSQYSYGDTGNASLAIVGGSYVVGLRYADHDITKDGFYSNFLDEETFTEISTAYIDPSPLGDKGYRWIIGFDAINYEVYLTASRYSSLGTFNLPMIHFTKGDTTFNVLGFDASGLNPDISLVDSNNVPRLGSTEEEANSVFGLSMKSETQEWTDRGVTKLISRNGGEFTGDSEYLTDSRKQAPSLMFYLYHAKNITCSGDLGTVVVTLQAAVPITPIDFDIKFITITVYLDSNNAESDSYDASITYDKRYEMPATSAVNITNQSQFTTYFSLVTYNNDVTKVYGIDNDNYHVLVTNTPLPLNTMITMLDFNQNPNRPEYYYFRVTQSVYNDSLTQLSTYNEITYRLSDFIKMDSTSGGNTYDDAAANLIYYDTATGFVDEEFLFIFDLKENTATDVKLGNKILFELRNNEDRTVFNVSSARESLMVYNTYESSTAVLSQDFSDVDSYLYYNIADEFTYSTDIQYLETENRQSVIDTNYESSSMGLNVSFLDTDMEQVSSSLLIGTNIKMNGQQYFADGDGVFRIKLANKVSSLNRAAELTVNSDLPPGEYTLRYTLFASDDGLHNSNPANSITKDFQVVVVSSENSIVVDCDDEVKVVDGATGLNYLGTRMNSYKVKYQSVLTNPNFRVEVLKRDTTTIDTTQFESVPFHQLFTNDFTLKGNEAVLPMTEEEQTFDFELAQNLKSGTYRIIFKLYDNNQLIDEDVKYVIVKKKIEE